MATYSSFRLLPALAVLPFIAGCINDSASWLIDGGDHALTLIREQPWFWSDKVDLFVVAARLPECQRRHTLAPGTTARADLDVYQTGNNDFVLKQGERYYRIETRTCTGFAPLDAAPGDLGGRRGSFREQGGRLRFVSESGA